MTDSRPNLVKILATRDPRDRAWELPELFLRGAGASVSIVGWVLDSRPVDAGVPEQVAAILAGALTTCYALTFLDPGTAGRPPVADRWSPTTAGWIRDLRPGGLGHLLGAPVLPLVSTNRPEVARRLFFAPGFCWEQRAQVVVLASPQSGPPDLPYKMYDLWLRHRQVDARVIEDERRAVGLLVPGPDGDFAEFLFLDPDSRDRALVALAEQSRTANVEFAVVPEEEFRSTRWYLSE